MTKIKTSRLSQRSYLVERAHSLLPHRVRVTYHPEFKAWIAAADWRRDLYTDPLPTLRLAKFNAHLMIAQEVANLEGDTVNVNLIKRYHGMA
jgi:hypothetical protein